MPSKVLLRANQFKQSPAIEDPRTVKIGLGKTCCYAVLLLLGFIILAVFTFESERTKTITVENNYDAYKEAEEFDPVCECADKRTRISIFNDISTVKQAYLDSVTRKDGLLYADGQPKHICAFILTATDNTKSGLPTTVQAFVDNLLENAIKPRCDLVQAAGFTSVKVLLDQTLPNRELASRFVFEDLVWEAVSTFDLAQGDAYFTMEKNSVVAGVSPTLGFSPGIDLHGALGSTSTSPGCSDPASATYTSSFEYTINSVTSTGYCYIPSAALNINMRTFNQAFATAYSTSDLSSYHAYPNNTDANFEVYFAGITDYFTNRASAPQTSLPISDAMFKQYYERCNPSKCTYTETGTPGVIESITLAFGLLGGLMNSLRFVIGLVGGVLFGKCIKEQTEPDHGTGDASSSAAGDKETELRNVKGSGEV